MRTTAAPDLVLATTSRYRLELMSRLGVPYRAVAHHVDERELERSIAPRAGDPHDERLALTLAMAKAESLVSEHPAALLLGSDQVVSLEGEILGKPGTEAAAQAQLARLAGRTHRIVTAVTLRTPDGAHRSHVDVHRMRMRALAPAAIAEYVARDQPLDCAGSYKLEGLGIALFEAIEGADHTAIIGLPLIAVVSLLASVGIAIPYAPRG